MRNLIKSLGEIQKDCIETSTTVDDFSNLIQKCKQVCCTRTLLAAAAAVALDSSVIRVYLVSTSQVCNNRVYCQCTLYTTQVLT